MGRPVSPSSSLSTPAFALTTRVASGLKVHHALGMVLPFGLLNTTGGGVVASTFTTHRFSPPTSAPRRFPLRESVWHATHWPTSFGVMKVVGAASAIEARMTPACVVDQ